MELLNILDKHFLKMYFRNFYQRNNDISSSISCVNGHLKSPTTATSITLLAETPAVPDSCYQICMNQRLLVSASANMFTEEKGIFVKVHVEPDTKLVFYNGISLALDLFNL